jgi:hypothetical protein
MLGIINHLDFALKMQSSRKRGPASFFPVKIILRGLAARDGPPQSSHLLETASQSQSCDQLERDSLPQSNNLL